MKHRALSRRMFAAGLVALLPALFFLAGFGREGQDDAPVRVGAAISLKEAMEEIAAAYEKQSGRKIELTFGSSGQLAGQIRSGAPIDLFISAAHKQIEDLNEAKLVDKSKARVIARNTLVLIVPADAKDAPASFADLVNEKVQRLAIGEPKTVPAGQYAEQVLTKLKILDGLRGRIVYGTNVRQVLDYVERGEVSAGIVYKTDALESGSKVHQVAVAEADWHEPIEYPVVVVSNSSRRAGAEAFLEFLMTPEAQQVFEARGFAPATSSATTRFTP